MSAAGGETVTVFGTGFSAVTAVNFGTATAVPTIISDTELVFTTPAHDPGPGPVSLSLPWGTIITCGCCIGFGNPLCCLGCGVIIVASATITAVNPATGATTGGNNVTITGTDLTYTSQVLFDTEPADFTVISDTEVTAGAPAHIAGTVPLSVITPGGTTTIDYTYISGPAI